MALQLHWLAPWSGLHPWLFPTPWNEHREATHQYEYERVLASVRSDLFPQLGWMSSLMSLVAYGLSRCSYIIPQLDGCLFQTFIRWLLNDRRPELGRLWIPWEYDRDCETFLELLSDRVRPDRHPFVWSMIWKIWMRVSSNDYAIYNILVEELPTLVLIWSIFKVLSRVPTR